MTLLDPTAWLLIGGSFIGTFVSAAFALGGGFILLAILSVIFPLSSAVPIHSSLVLGLSLSRVWYFRKYIYWNIVLPFIGGCVIGAFTGARVFVDLPEAFIAVAIGSIMLLAVWFPKVDWKPPFKHPFFLVGIGHSFLSTLFTFGGLYQPLMIRTSLEKMQIIATLSAGLLVMNCFKVTGYALFGFDYRPYLVILGTAILAAFPGAWLGKKVAHRIQEHHFRLVFRLIITLFAFRLLYRAWVLSI